MSFADDTPNLLQNIEKSYDTLNHFRDVNLSLKPTQKLQILSWEKINVVVDEQKKSWFRKASVEKLKSIIKDVNGIAKPGQVLAIMGASGAGKTTLLNVLNYRNRGNLQIEGEIRLNGQLIKSPSTLAAVSGYVQQEDLFYGTLTVKEHLKFQAMLRMEKGFSKRERMERIEQVMNDLNLKKCENTLIGNPAINLKGISGGERRRLGFATEIITNPGLLFCDEPTSGLDSFMALSVVECMKNLANQGKTIICTIHQPSSEIFELFDRLCLLAEGRLAYLGDLNEANRYFSSLNFNCPSNYNPADFYIQKLAISPFEKEKSEERVKMICDNFVESDFMLDLKKSIEDSKQNSVAKIFSDNYEISPYKVNSLKQFGWLTWRNVIDTARNPMQTKIQFLQTIFLAVIFGLIFLRQKLNQKAVQNINGVIFLCITNVSFSNLFSVINSFPPEIPIFLREHSNGMYRVINYYLSKIIIELPGFIIFPAIFISIVYWMSNLNNDIYRFLICAGIIVLVSNVSSSFGALISSFSSSAGTATAIAGPLITPVMIFGGSFLNNDSIPSYLRWLKYISWMGYSNEIMSVNQWDGIKNITCETHLPNCFENGDEVLTFFTMKKSRVFTDLVILGSLYVACKIMTFFFLLFRSYRNK